MLKTYTCIICPNGCEIIAQLEDGQIIAMEGAACKRGESYVHQELTAPMRNIASSVLVDGGILPLVSVRLSAPIPKERVFDTMAVIRQQLLNAPVHTGQVVIADVLGLGVDLIVTKNVPQA